jgi:hypothetical protein
MLAHCEMRSPFTFHLSNRVVEGIIRDVLLDNGADDAENVRALSIFQKSSQEDDEIAVYVPEVKNVEQFLLPLGFLQFNASFRAVYGILQGTKSMTGLSRMHNSAGGPGCSNCVRGQFGEDFGAIVCGVGLLYRP